ncbi:site-specific DNA-methyltransferase [Aciduricibacillus chroicocephali]|uniref:Site-specific DNA-methyltransferase n=1 Tax=Aciduricibacillus chroicocephali TaxID=3054939 RepID=A0ABY9KUM0_9BACI|nr:site-specific DNA-methyltransferase [Bacillaceae bacterium 44XB]WLV25847.1 site-specific DNA-methyltransferase [Bacillaceae bacterium 44XB]
MEEQLIKKVGSLLKLFPQYWEGEQLLRNMVIEDLRAYKPELLEVLLSDQEIREMYAVEIAGSLLFKIDEFIDMLRYKNYWANSYTKYQNKIGLTSGGRYLDYNSDVILDFPYKDSILEGGMEKENVGRKEVYYNKIIAKKEIDQLLAQKVFVNVRKYNENKTEAVNFITDEDNLVIKGNNLLALHSLKERYSDKVKLIYVDPPYNTEQDSFKYNDRFSHSTWLTFMKNRLEIARELMQDKGLIFVHIGDQEMHYLKVMMDSIFERENFVATIPRKTRSGKSDVPYKLSQDYDWILVYTKGSAKTDKLFQREVERKYYISEDFPNDEWRLSDLTKQTSTKERPNSDFTLVNPRNGESFPVNPNRSWAVTKDTVDDYLKRGKIVFPGDYEFLNIKQPSMRVFKSEEIKKYGKGFNKAYVSTEFINQTMDVLLKQAVNKKGTDEIVDLFGEKVFPYPKNEILLQKIIEYTTNEGDLVLDFFMGSATTQAVALKMNRKFIGIEQMDYIESISIPRLEKVIKGEQGGISKDVDWHGGGSFVYVELYNLNNKYINEIQKASNQNDIEKLIYDMKESAYLDFQVKLNQVTLDNEDFLKLSIDEQKKSLLEILDMNQLYLNYSEIDDEQFCISANDRQFNESFYGKG